MINNTAEIIFFIMNNINWPSIAEHAFKTIIIGGSVFIIGLFIKKWTDKALRTYQIRFSKLHSDRADVIRELYSKLVNMEKSLRSYMNRVQYKNAPSEKEQQEMAAKDTGNFITFFDENRIFFDTNVCDLIEKIYEECRKAWIDFHIYSDVTHLPQVIQSKKAELQLDAYNSIKEKFPELRKKLEDEFRKLLGVEK
jgi:hypothetical protein